MWDLHLDAMKNFVSVSKKIEFLIFLIDGAATFTRSDKKHENWKYCCKWFWNAESKYSVTI